MSLSHREILALQTSVVRKEWEKLAGLSELEDAALKPRELVTATDSLIKNERMAHGEATEKVQVLGALTDAELAQYIALAEKAESK